MPDLLDLLGVALLGLFVFAIWPPLVLLVAGIAALVASAALEARRDKRRRE